MMLFVVVFIALLLFFLLTKYAPRLPLCGVFAGLEKIIC